MMNSVIVNKIEELQESTVATLIFLNDSTDSLIYPNMRKGNVC
jgi:hypothetical protein